jgi:hypothetical protein
VISYWGNINDKFLKHVFKKVFGLQMGEIDSLDYSVVENIIYFGNL